MLRTSRQGPTVASIRRAIQQGLDRPETPALTASLNSRSTPQVPDLFEQANVNFTDKKWVWVPHEKEGYIAGYVTKEESDNIVVVHLMTGRDITVNLDDTYKVNPPKFEKVDDMADLGYLNEASVVHNLKQRYACNMIYTYSGLFLVAVNPYYDLQIYGPEFVAGYKNKKRTEVTPHIFAIADAAFHDMLHSKENQSILITGESGAGKTENTKKVIQYLTAIAGDHKAAAAGSAVSGSSLEQQVLSANPILESFGNAQTIRNNNSSRFGKFIRIEFNFAGQIAGASIEWYLFEKPRVTNQSKQERNYHVFYQFMKGADKAVKDKLLIDKGPEGYAFTKKCRQTIQGVDDRAEYDTLVRAMETTGFRAEEQLDLFRIIAAILHMGNMQFQATRNDEAVLGEQVAAEKLCHVLGIQLADFTRALLRPRIKAGRDWVTQSRTLQQVEYSVEALARSLYERMFGSLVGRINAAMGRPDGKSTFIGVLDIAGFEILETNSFEQLCINYTNERLQQFFNRTMFVLEQEEYKREGIEWNFIDFGMDLQPTIDLIDRTKPIGIMSCLDEECVMPKATDKTFTEKLHGLWAGRSDKYDAPRFDMGFIVKHYASQVEYSTHGWLEKNKDPLNENVTRLLGNSSEPFVAQLYADYADSEGGVDPSSASAAAGGGGGRARVATTLKRGAFRTVGQRHKDQLNLLMAQLNATQPHFVRCILPNGEKRAGKIDTPLVLDQLRCNGVLEGIRITRQGYPNRVAFAEFRQRYEILAPNVIPRQVFVDSKQAASLLLDALRIDAAKYRLGHTKVFFRAGMLAELEEVRDVELSKIITQLQAVARGALSRSRFRRRIEQARAIRVIQSNARIYNQLSEWPWWKLYRTVKPLLHVTRVDEEMRKREAQIAALEARVQGEEAERRRLEQEQHELARAKGDIEALLNSERSAAVDQEEILKRTQERAEALEDSLREHAARLEELEEQGAELARTRAALETQLAAATRRAESETVAMRDLASQHARRDEDLAAAQAAAAEYRQALEALEADHSAALERSGALEAALSEGRDVEARVAGQLAQLQAALAARDRELEARASSAAEQSAQAQQAAAGAARLEAELADAARHKAAAAAEAERLRAQLAEALAARGALEAEAGDRGLRLAAAEQSLAHAQQERQRLADAAAHMTGEIDELRQLIDETADQGTRESEMRRLREGELTKLRGELGDAAAELEAARQARLAAEQALRGELDALRREREHAVQERDDLAAHGEQAEAQLHEHAARLEALEALNAALEARLAESAAEARAAAAARADAEQGHAQAAQQLAAAQQQAAALAAERTQLAERLAQAESAASHTTSTLTGAQAELLAARRTAGELQARLDENESLKDALQQRVTTQSQEHEELQERYERDAVARVRQLEHASQDAAAALDDMRAGYDELDARCAALEKTRGRLASELEDARLQAERDGSHARDLEQANAAFQAQHDRLAAELAAAQAAAAQADARLAARASEIDTLRSTHVETDRRLRSLVDEVGDGASNMRSLQAAHDALEADAAGLRAQLEQEQAAHATARDIKARWEAQHAEMQARLHAEMAAAEGRAEDSRRQLLADVDALGARLEAEAAARERAERERDQAGAELQRLQQAADGSARVRSEAEQARRELAAKLREAEVEAEALRKAVADYTALADRHERRGGGLQQTLEARDRELTQLGRKAQRTERRLEEVMAQAAYHLDARNRLDGENVELREKLDDAYRRLGDSAAAAASATDSARALGSPGAGAQQADAQLRALEDSRQALAAALHAAQREVEDKQHELVDLDRSFGALQDELERAHAALLAAERERNEARDALAGAREQLAAERAQRGSNEERSADLGSRLEHLRAALAACEASLGDAADERAHAEKVAATARAESADARGALAEAERARDAAEASVHVLEGQLLELQARLDDSLLAVAEHQHVRDGLQRELGAIADRHRGDYDVHGRALDELRGTYHRELEDTTRELEAIKKDHVDLREAYIALDSSLALRTQELDRAAEEAADARKELLRVMAKLEELVPAYEAARDAAKALEAELDTARHDRASAAARAAEARALLDETRAAKEKLELRLDEVQNKYIEASQGRQTAEKAALQLEDDVRSARAKLAEINDDQASAEDRVARLDAVVADVHLALDKEREANTILTKDKNTLEKQLKELRLRIVKLETEAVAEQVSGGKRASPVPADLAARVEAQAKASLEAQQKAKQMERQIRELQFQIAEKDKAKQRTEIDVQRMASRIKRLDEHVKQLEASEAQLATAKHRLERELGALRSRTASPAF
ncbi:class II myosin [Coemansia erecta]|uniref:Class II myosin n=1 Tax=Coemansia erecta TaxID=147472 RepID=A0A9W8CSA2_9FUNG|nr:class II myosin [Coemansia erecta]